MRSPSIEWLHAKLEKHIKLAQAYTEIEKLEFIIKACRLKPYYYIFEGRDNELILHRWWFDEFGNSFTISKHKKIHITYNDLRLDRKQIVCTDLYYGLSLDRIAKMSKMVHLVTGKDEDLYQDCYLLTFLGLDNHLRSYLYWYGEWQQVSPLVMGMKNLGHLAKNLDIKQFRQIGKKEKSVIPCVSGETWLSCAVPLPEAFLAMLSKKHEIIYNILSPEKEGNE
jgi:hypothetical protein